MQKRNMTPNIVDRKKKIRDLFPLHNTPHASESSSISSPLPFFSFSVLLPLRSQVIELINNFFRVRTIILS